MSDTPLLPCPFCGSDAIVWSDSYARVRCNQCFMGTMNHGLSKERAYAGWNRRAPRELESLRAGREEILEECAKVCESKRDRTDWKTNVIPLEVRGHTDAVIECAKAIRSLKQPLPEREG